jgi:Raf kinase inhibitor-like YbhB/YbcL family protein
VIYRVSYKGGPGAEQKLAFVSESAPTKDAPSPRAQIAIDALGVRDRLGISLSSASFASGGSIPLKHSDYGQKASPALAWSGAPSETKSYVILVDDPDAKPKLVNHWGIYNIPPATVSLREGVPGDIALALPKGAMQTLSTRGAPGYVGPRPPAGDPPHHYHFQIFALDTTLKLPPGAASGDLIAAMKGHVLATGVLIGTFQRDKNVQETVDAAKDIHR